MRSIGAVIFLALLVAAGCDRSPSVPRPAAGAPAAVRTPRETIARLIAAHSSGSYREMESLMVAGRAAGAVRTLTAIDEFLLANRLLCDHVREKLSPAIAQMIDQAQIAGNLDIFSPYVELVEEEIHGDEAEVSFSVDGRLPLKRTRLVRVGGQWKYDPGEDYGANLPDAFRRMADGLRLVLDGLKQGRPPLDRILEKPELLVEEVRVRLVPGVSMLQPATKPTK